MIGRGGNDYLIGGPDGDTFVWNPGDGSDTIEGQGGDDLLTFNGSNIGEIVELSANGTRLRFTRNVANILLDVAGVERVTFNALGGADNAIINDLTGTSVTQVTVDLAAFGGTGDASTDLVTLQGNAAANTFSLSANAGAVEAVGLGALVRVVNAELTNDFINIIGVGGDTVNINGSSGPDVMTVTANGTNAAVVNATGFTIPVQVGGALTLYVNGLGGADMISCVGNLAAIVPLVLDGGDGDDTIFGGNGADRIIGGPGNDILDGNQGNDVIFAGADNDTIVWDPGDGNDTIEGQSGDDVLVFNGSNVGEVVELSANGSRLRFTRNVANILLDVAGVERVTFNARGGVDNTIVNDLTGTGVSLVTVDLSVLGGGGDAQADTITVNGTAAADTFNVTTSGGVITVSGVGPPINISHPEVAFDSLILNGLLGTDIFAVSPGVSSLITVTTNQ